MVRRAKVDTDYLKPPENYNCILHVTELPVFIDSTSLHFSGFSLFGSYHSYDIGFLHAICLLRGRMAVFI